MQTWWPSQGHSLELGNLSGQRRGSQRRQGWHEAVGRNLGIGRGSDAHLCVSNGDGVFKDSPEHRWFTARRGQRPGVSVVAQEPQSTWQQRSQREGGRQIHRGPWRVEEKLELVSPALAPHPHNYQPRWDPPAPYQVKINFSNQTQWQRNWYCPCPPPGGSLREREALRFCVCVQG